MLDSEERKDVIGRVGFPGRLPNPLTVHCVHSSILTGPKQLRLKRQRAETTYGRDSPGPKRPVTDVGRNHGYQKIKLWKSNF